MLVCQHDGIPCFSDSGTATWRAIAYTGSTQWKHLFTQCVVPPYKTHTHTTNFILSACCLHILAGLSCCTAHELKGWKMWWWVCAGLTHPAPPSIMFIYWPHSSTDDECKSMVHCNQSYFPQLLYTPPQGNTKSTIQLVLPYKFLLENTLHEETQGPLHYNWSYLNTLVK